MTNYFDDEIEIGDKINLPFGQGHLEYEEKFESGEEREYTNLTVLGVLEKSNIGEEYNYNGSINIITTEKVFNNIFYHEGLSSGRMPSSDMNIIMDNNGDREEVRLLLEELEGSRNRVFKEKAKERYKIEAKNSELKHRHGNNIASLSGLGIYCIKLNMQKLSKIKLCI